MSKNSVPNMQNKSVISRLGGQKFIVLLVVIGLIIFFSAVSPDFRKYSTAMSILDYSYYITLMAIGVTFPLITGGVDLSIGTGLICYSLTGGFLIVQKGWPVWAGMLVAVLLGIAIGFLNGVLVSIMNLPPFLATLCTCMITRGLGSIFSKGFGISWPTTGAPGSWFRNIFKITVNGTKIPLGFLWVLLLVAVMAFVLNHTKIGRYTIAIGSNKEATILSGINVKFYHIMAYVISGFFAGLAAIAAAPLTYFLLGSWGVYIAILCGLIGGCAIGYFTEDYTSDTVSSCRDMLTVKLTDILVSIRTKVVSLIFVQSQVKLRTMLNYRFIKRR